MKKKVYVITSLAISVSIFTGCASKTTETTSNTNNSTATQSDSTTKQLNAILGEVTEIKDNTITLKLIETQNRNRGNNGGTRNTQRNSGTAGSATSGAPEKSENGQPQNGGQPQSQQQNGNSGQPPKMETKYTGETETITIPSGTSITAFSRSSRDTSNSNASADGSKDATEKALAITDIKVGDRLNISYSDSTQKTISKVSVMGQVQPQSQSQNQIQSTQ